MKEIPVRLNLSRASEVLEAARKIIRNEKRWVSHDLAVDAAGVTCPTTSKQAQAFCALGAVRRINGPQQRAATAYLRQAANVVSGATESRPTNDTIFHVNDTLGHPETLKMFQLAIKAARRDEK